MTARLDRNNPKARTLQRTACYQKTASEYVEENQLHKEDIELFELIKDVAYEISRKYRLRLTAIEPQPQNSNSFGQLGCCWRGSHIIHILFRRRFPKAGRTYYNHYEQKYFETQPHEAGEWQGFNLCDVGHGSYIPPNGKRYPHLSRKDTPVLDTIIHEVAHLRHPNHSKKFWRFYKQLKDEYNPTADDSRGISTRWADVHFEDDDATLEHVKRFEDMIEDDYDHGCLTHLYDELRKKISSRQNLLKVKA